MFDYRRISLTYIECNYIIITIDLDSWNYWLIWGLQISSVVQPYLAWLVEMNIFFRGMGQNNRPDWIMGGAFCWLMSNYCGNEQLRKVSMNHFFRKAYVGNAKAISKIDQDYLYHINVFHHPKKQIFSCFNLPLISRYFLSTSNVNSFQAAAGWGLTGRSRPSATARWSCGFDLHGSLGKLCEKMEVYKWEIHPHMRNIIGIS